MSSTILHRVQLFLTEANKASVPVSSTIIDEFGQACKEAFRKQFTDTREDKFRFRMSSIGRPLCQLQMEHNGAEREPMPYNAKMRNLFGDLIEAAAIAIMQSAGINIESKQKKVTHKFNGDSINGSYDVKIEGRVWDIKSASPLSFEYKFGEKGGFDTIAKKDDFGYVTQGYLYSNAEGCDFGGWIVINKSTGEWCLTETPIADGEYNKNAIQMAEDNIKALKNNDEFKRCFTDSEEFFNKKPTGNRILGTTCGFCPYKKACWGESLQYLPQQQSKAMNPKWYWYTDVQNPRVEDEN